MAVFDTAFHATIPKEAATYPIPRAWRERWGIRRYGFHGLAVESVVAQLDAERIVVCHLGGGCSVTAVRDRRSIDTTMGFTPLEGVPMATRSGSVNPGALIHLLRERGLSVDELDRALEHESGLSALGGLDDPLGFGVFTYRVSGAVAQMASALGGMDVLAFSGGVGENRQDVREAIAERTSFLGSTSRRRWCPPERNWPSRAASVSSSRAECESPAPGLSHLPNGATGRLECRRLRTTCSRTR